MPVLLRTMCLKKESELPLFSLLPCISFHLIRDRRRAWLSSLPRACHMYLLYRFKDTIVQHGSACRSVLHCSHCGHSSQLQHTLPILYQLLRTIQCHKGSLDGGMCSVWPASACCMICTRLHCPQHSPSSSTSQQLSLTITGQRQQMHATLALLMMSFHTLKRMVCSLLWSLPRCD